MTQLSFLAWTVTDLTRYLRDLLESDFNLQDVWVEGEVSNFSQPRSGHVYFTLKDDRAALRCVMWRSVVARQAYLPRDGEAVLVHGKVSVYEAGGQYQLYADRIQPVGTGALFQAFLELKARLQAEGLFDEDRKRPIPAWPRRIGVVTSPTGAALRDILNTIRRRYPLAEVVLAPTSVQGIEAPPGIVAALEALQRLAPPPNVILVARGGGSLEDLWAFNDERVVRAVAACRVPVISGVGHETDFTLTDFAADRRAPTPTAAAELATPDQADLRATLAERHARLIRAVQRALEAERIALHAIYQRLARHAPLTRIRSDQQRLDEWSLRMKRALTHRVTLERARLTALQSHLDALSPLAVLRRGYALVTDAQGRVVHSVRQVRPGNRLSVRVQDGAFPAQVLEETDGEREAR